MSIWEQVLQEEPENCLAHIYIGQAAAKSGDRDKALFMVNKSKRLNPSVEEIFEVGNLYYQLKMFRDALREYLEAMRLGYKDKGRAYAAISDCYVSMSDYARAAQYANKALKLNADFDDVKDILLWSAENGGAASMLNTLVRERRQTCLAFLLLAQESLQKKDSLKAEEIVSEAERLKPSAVEMYYIGRLWYNLGAFEKALNILRRCERLGYENKGMLYDSVANCHMCMGDYDEAIKYAVMSLVINPDDQNAKDVLYACREATWGSEFGDNY